MPNWNIVAPKEIVPKMVKFPRPSFKGVTRNFDPISCTPPE